MIIINEWVEGYYTYGRLNSPGFCALEDIEHSLEQHQWDKDKAIEQVMFNHNIEIEQATGMIEWAMSMLTMPGFVASVKTPEAQQSAAIKEAKDIFLNAIKSEFKVIENHTDNSHQQYGPAYVSGKLLEYIFRHLDYNDLTSRVKIISIGIKKDDLTIDLQTIPESSMVEFVTSFEVIGMAGDIVAMQATVSADNTIDIEKAKLALKANSVNKIPHGWLACDGAVLDIDSTPELFAAIGRKFNTGGELTGQFRLPDLRIGPAITTPSNKIIKYSNDKHGNAGDITEMTTGKDGA